jgi:hypothetical protein
MTDKIALGTDVSVTEYLAHARPLPYLYDLAPHQDPEAFRPEGPDVGAPLFATIRAGGGRRTDVRLLVDDGETYQNLANALAQNLRCDVYVSPHGAEVRYTREATPVGGQEWEATAIDRNTGEPVPWLVVRPPDLPTHVATWFISARGRLRPNAGLVTVTLPDGLGFATKNTFRDTAYLAARMRPGTSRITTLAVNADLGRFEISRFDDTTALLGGVEFATLVGASLDLIHPDVQIALTWPTDTTACAALDTELMRLADALNRTVWVPEPQGAAFVQAGCGEFAAVDEVGGASRWRAYPSRMTGEFRPRYGSDLDGRLVPLGDVSAAAFPAVSIVSVPAGQLQRLRPWYEQLNPRPGTFTLDLAVLADGRLALQIKDAPAVAVAPREMRALLREAGWAGEDIVLLAEPPLGRWEALVEHAQTLVDVFGIDIWVVSDEAWLRAGSQQVGGVREDWFIVRYNQPAGPPAIGIPLPPPLPIRPAPMPVPVSPWSNSPAGAASDETTVLHLGSPDLWSTSGEYEAVRPTSGPVIDPVRSVIDTTGTVTITDPGGINGDYLSEAERARAAALAQPTMAVPMYGVPTVYGGHGVHWLPPNPVRNKRALDLYLFTATGNESEVASADLFLIAGSDPLRMAERVGAGYLLRVAVPDDGAVDLSEHESAVPAALKARLEATAGTHLLPATWFGDVRVTARYDLDGRGGVTARHDLSPTELVMRFDGAGHGVPGLPNEVVNWPEKGQPPAKTLSYLVVPESGASSADLVERGYVTLVRTRPAVEQGTRVLEVKVKQRKAIDVPATLNQLGRLASPDGRSASSRAAARLHDFVGLDLLLPVDDLELATVTKVYRPGPGKRPLVEKLTDTTLLDALAPA